MQAHTTSHPHTTHHHITSHNTHHITSHTTHTHHTSHHLITHPALSHSPHQPRRDPPTSVLMLGIPPFFFQFTELATVEEHLESHPAALQGLMDVLERSRRAADFALGFAVHRMDHDAQLIYSATLLHDVAEMLLWLKAPALAAAWDWARACAWACSVCEGRARLRCSNTKPSSTLAPWPVRRLGFCQIGVTLREVSSCSRLRRMVWIVRSISLPT